MRIEQLQYLVEVAETKSINLAAENNYISQQALSEAIRKLEQEFGVSFLARSYQGVHLTEEGKVLVKKAKVILKIIEDLKNKFKSDEATEVSTLTGNLSIIVSYMLNKSLFQNILTTFSKKHPQVNIIINEKDFANTISSVLANKADIGILVAVDELFAGDEPNSLKFNKEVYFEKLYSDKAAVCVGKTSPLADRKSISMKEAMKYPAIVYQPEEASVDSWYVNRTRSYGEFKKLIVTSSADVYRETIVNGLAVGFNSTLFLKGSHLLHDITKISVSDNISITCGWVRSKNRELSEAAKEFISLLHRFSR